MNSITCTQNAANRIAELMLEESNPNLNLRIYITGGGCSGFQYGFMFDENIREDDQVIEHTVEQPGKGVFTVKIVVDALSLMYLEGAQVHYIENLQGARFTVKNPNAQTTCSCGSSFSLDTPTEE